ncbi:MAG: hypothetical protein KJ063_07830 [Anaerolineae bacterium]|nr:hypothetical protein [Anaerolineae bacterium]
MNGTFSEERLVHFRCGGCGRWWTIGDAPPKRRNWFCPWCGQEQTMLPPEPTPGPALSEERKDPKQ